MDVKINRYFYPYFDTTEGIAPPTEVRLNEDRTVDEIVMHAPLLFHLEQMDDGHWWMRLTRSDGQDMDINLYTKRGAAIACNVQSDDGKICEGFGAFSNGGDKRP